MGTQECRECGVSFELRGRGPYRYCEAHRVSRAEAKARDQRNLRKRRREAKSPARCRVCGASFWAKRSDANQCSDECKRLDLNRRAREFDLRHRGKCVECGQEIARRSTRCKSCGNKVAGRIRSGENAWNWKGGRSRDGHGYIQILVAPENRKGHRYRPEHILVWEEANGRPLPKGWVIHHINGIKDDNRLENLEPMPRKKHNDTHTKRIAELEARVRELRRELVLLKTKYSAG